MSLSASVSASIYGVSLTLSLDISDTAFGTSPGDQAIFCDDFGSGDRARIALSEMHQELSRLIDTLPLKIQTRVVQELSVLVDQKEQVLTDLKKIKTDFAPVSEKEEA